jgi:hypothetical protein
MNYFEQVKPTYIENWPQSLRRLSFSTEMFPLSEQEVDSLLSAYLAFNGDQPLREDWETCLDYLQGTINNYVQSFPNGAFVRLGSRSPKDSWYGHERGYCCVSGQEAINMLRESERVWDDLQLARHNEYRPYLCVREWVKIPWYQEFRVFIRDREIVGVSQYDYTKKYPRDDTHEGRDEETIKWVANMFFCEYLEPALHLDNVVADIWIRMRAYDNTRVWETKLIEINPFMAHTDPCLFDWDTLRNCEHSWDVEVRLI